jgi:sugar/nucleoside kinase (ribokinase family)
MAEIKEEDLLNYVDAYVETLGAKWSRYISNNEIFTVSTQTVETIADPTGAWDAFRAGILWALHNGKSWKEGMEKWTELSCACIQQYGTQNHWWHL